jgi:hypothetical protein
MNSNRIVVGILCFQTDNILKYKYDIFKYKCNCCRVDCKFGSGTRVAENSALNRRSEGSSPFGSTRDTNTLCCVGCNVEKCVVMVSRGVCAVWGL